MTDKNEAAAMNDQPSTITAPGASAAETAETLVVVSKVKKLIRGMSQLNTSECAIDALSAQIVETCKRAIENAKSSGRKTVMGRDIK